MTEATESVINAWRYITGFDVTDVRVLAAARNEPEYFSIDGVPIKHNDRIELQIGGVWPENRPLGVYTFNSAAIQLNEVDDPQ